MTLTQRPTEPGEHDHTTEDLYRIIAGSEGTWAIIQDPLNTYLRLTYDDHHTNLYPDGTTRTIYDLTYPDGKPWHHDGTTATEDPWFEYLDTHPDYLTQDEP